MRWYFGIVFLFETKLSDVSIKLLFSESCVLAVLVRVLSFDITYLNFVFS